MSLYPYFIYFLKCDWFPHLPVQPSTECTRTDTLNYDPILFFDGMCHKTQPQTNHHPSIGRHSRHVQPLTPTIRLLSTCALTPPSIPSLSLIGGMTRRFHIPIHEENVYRITLKERRLHRLTNLPQTTDPSHFPHQHLHIQFLPCHESPGLLGGPSHLYP